MLAPADLEPIPEILAPFSPQALEVLARASELRTCAPAERIFARGDDADGIYVVRGGEIQIRLEAKQMPWKLASIGPGGVVGEMSLLGSQRRRNADAYAGPQGATLLFIPLTIIRELRQSFPAEFTGALLTLAGLVVERLDRTNQRLVERLAAERVEGLQRDLVVHDLRGPLATIEAGAQSLLGRQEHYGPVAPRQRTALVRISKNVAFMRLLVDSILEVERARQQPTQARRTNLGEVVAACAEPLLALVAPERMGDGEEAPLAALEGTRLRLPAPEARSLPILADPLRLAQVLLNLIGNAARYTEGAIEIAVRAGATGRLLIEVSDHGAGIPPEQREKIFDAFKRRELEDQRLPVGKGFGLAGVRELVQSMQGTISVGERRDGQPGAVFRVELPAEGS